MEINLKHRILLPFAISASSCEFVTTLGSLLRAPERFG